MKDDPVYQESLTSNRTLTLFAALALICLVVGAWRVSSAGMDALAVFLLLFFIFFLFYTINFRKLTIRITPDALKLKFGIFSWTVQVANIAGCELDDLSGLQRNGGAGIHFMFVNNRYRASFNFLEYERVVVALRRKAGSVQDVSFSTRQPEEVIRHIRQAIAASRAGQNTSPVA